MEVLMDGLITTIIGMGTVFLVLIILYVLLIIMRYVFYDRKQNETKEKVSELPEKEVISIDEKEDVEELIAVITAAIASSLNTSTYNLNVKSFKRIGQNSPIWNTVSREKHLNTVKNLK